MFPFRTDIWRDNAIHAQNLLISIVNIISSHERVFLCVDRNNIQRILPEFNSNVNIIEIAYDDIWARDITPFFVMTPNGLISVRFRFNAWGGYDEGSYFPWDNDAKFGKNISDKLGLASVLVNLIVEGGSIVHNGKKVAITTESVILNKNRNPHLTKPEAEGVLRDYLGIEKVIWLRRGLSYDETDGHADVFLNFVDEHQILLAWTEDRSSPQYDILNEIYLQLCDETALDGSAFTVHKILMPRPIEITIDEAKGITSCNNSINRLAGTKLYPTYNNAYVFNGGVLLPVFNCLEDEYAISVFKQLYPCRHIYPVYSKEILIGGGNFHCILHEIPKEGFDYDRFNILR